MNLAGKVSIQAMEIIESVQPYNGGYDGSQLSCLNEMDVIDKHHQLLVAHHAIVGSSTAGWGNTDDFLSGLPRITLFNVPLENGKVVAKLIYSSPHTELDPYLKFFPHVFFAKGSAPFAGRMVTAVLSELFGWVNAELLPRFAPLFR